MSKIDFLQMVISNPVIRMFIESLEVRQFIACQFALESDFGSSNLATVFNNYCGMKIPHKRCSYRNGVYKVYSTYYDFYHCCADYISWLLYNRPSNEVLENLDSYKIFLRNSCYCREKDYVYRIESIYNLYFNFKN